MATEVKTQLAERPLVSSKAEPEPEKKPEHQPRSHGDIGSQKEPVVPEIVDFELVQEELKTSKSQTPCAYHFGRLSHHSFFSRHHPQPQHVTHIPDTWKTKVKELAAKVAIFTKENELKTNEVGADQRSESGKKKEEPPLREQGAKYSAETGRLIPASSQALNWRSSQGQRGYPSGRDGEGQASLLQDQELLILELLCQILQTDSLSDIQFWLLYASPKEKDLALRLLQTAVAQLLPETLSSIPAETLLNQLQELQEPPQEMQQAPYSPSLKKMKTPPFSKIEKPESMGKAQVLRVHPSEDSEDRAAQKSKTEG